MTGQTINFIFIQEGLGFQQTKMIKKIIILILISVTILKSQLKIKDDTKHYHAGLGISLCTSALVYESTDNNKLSLAIGFASGVGAGVLKEYWLDKHLQRGTFR